MDPVDFLTMSGGVAGRDLLAASGRHAVRRALEAGLVVRVGRARFSLPVLAPSLGAVVRHRDLAHCDVAA